MFLLYVGTDHPALRYLYKYVKADIANDWFEIGVELFDVGDEAVLKTIKKNFPGDANKCASEMLQLWLDRKPEASWNQLLEALKEPNIKLNTLATKIEKMLSNGTYLYILEMQRYINISPYRDTLSSDSVPIHI